MVTTAVRSQAFQEGLKWRETIWAPHNNQEIGEDYFLSREILKSGKKIAWLDHNSPYGSHHKGRDEDELHEHLSYYLKTFSRRGMLSRLREMAPRRVKDIDAWESFHFTTELHDRFSLEHISFDESKLNHSQKDAYQKRFKDHIQLFKDIDPKRGPMDDESSRLIREARDYFDSIEDGHPFFSQQSLQAAIYFNLLHISFGRLCGQT